jgi:hypothetical protein
MLGIAFRTFDIQIDFYNTFQFNESGGYIFVGQFVTAVLTICHNRKVLIKPEHHAPAPKKPGPVDR